MASGCECSEERIHSDENVAESLLYIREIPVIRPPICLDRHIELSEPVKQPGSVNYGVPLTLLDLGDQ